MRIMPALNSVGVWVGAGWNTAVLGVSTPLADLWQWLAPDSIGTTDPIETWTDKSVNARDATQATVADRPALIDPLVNGFAGARYDTTDTLNTATALPLPWTIHTVAALTKPASKQYVVGSAGTGGTYVTSAGYVGVDLGGTGVEGTVDRSGSMIVVSAVAEETINLNIEASDDFSASGDDSGVGGIGNLPNDRWAVATSNATWTVTGGNLVMNFSGGTGAVRLDNIRIDVDIAGDFTLEMPITVNAFGNDQNWIGLIGHAGGVDHAISWTNSSGVQQYRQNPPTFTNLVTTDLVTTLKVERVSGVIRSYHNGIQLGPDAVQAANLTQIRIDVRHDAGTDLNVTIPYISAKDGLGNPLRLPPLVTQSATLYVNGVEEATGAIGSGTLPSVDMLAAGLAGDVPESLIYSAAQDESTIQAIAAGLATEYGL